MGNPYDPRQHGDAGQQPNSGYGQANPQDVTQHAQHQQPEGQYGAPATAQYVQPEVGQYGPPQGGPQYPQFNQSIPPEAAPYGQPGYGPPQGQGAPQWGPPYGAPPPRRGLDLGALDLTKIAAVVVIVAGIVVLISSLFSLYSITVEPSGLDVPDNDAPSGTVEVGIGFFDVLPILPPPIAAQAIPVLLVLAALCAVPLLFGSERKTAPLASVFAGTGALLALVLTISDPLPSVALSGDLAEQLEDEIGGQSVAELVDSVVSIGPGVGLILALVFGIIGWIAATLLVFKRGAQAPEAAPQPGQLPPQPGQLPLQGMPPGPSSPPRW